jgi:hypothetical protein
LLLFMNISSEKFAFNFNCLKTNKRKLIVKSNFSIVHDKKRKWVYWPLFGWAAQRTDTIQLRGWNCLGFVNRNVFFFKNNVGNWFNSFSFRFGSFIFWIYFNLWITYNLLFYS